MAEHLDDGAFWLPPQFLTDDDILMDFNTNCINSRNGDKFSRERNTGSYSPYEFPCGFGSTGPYSDLSSPVESVVGSTETESDEEDYITGLTRKMAHSSLQDDFWKVDTGFVYENHKAMAGSPQSTLCSVLGGCGCKQGSSRGSPNCPSQISSPRATAEMSRKEAAWDLLYAAAGEVARMRLIEESTGGCYQNRGLLGPPRKPNPVSIPSKSPNYTANVGFHSNQPLSYQQLQVSQFQQLKQQQMLKQQSSAVWGQLSKPNSGQYQQEQTHQMVQNRARTSNGRPVNLSVSTWPTLQQSQQQPPPPQPGSGMRAVFLGNPAVKRECAGTGVFLPRRVGNPSETRKKPACSTVLLPDRVVQALNLKLDSMDAPPPHPQSRHGGGFSPDFEAALKYRNNVLASQQRRTVRPQPVMNSDFRLPQEWTY